MTHATNLYGITLVAALVVGSTAVAQEAGKPAKQNERAARRGLRAVDADREAAALRFVEEHHGELSELLQQLRKKRPQQYEQAIRDLAKQQQRLANFAQRQPERYKLELEQWKLKSRIQVMAARWSVSPNESLEREIRSAIREQTALRQKLLSYERQALQDRLAKIDRQLESLEDGGTDTAVERQYDALMARLERNRPKAKSGRGSPRPGQRSNADKKETSADGGSHDSVTKRPKEATAQ